MEPGGGKKPSQLLIVSEDSPPDSWRRAGSHQLFLSETHLELVSQAFDEAPRRARILSQKRLQLRWGSRGLGPDPLGFQPQLLRLQLKGEMKVKGADKQGRSRWIKGVTTEHVCFRCKGQELVPKSAQSPPHAHMPQIIFHSLEASRRSCKSLGGLDVSVTKILGSVLIFGPLTRVFPEL